MNKVLMILLFPIGFVFALFNRFPLPWKIKIIWIKIMSVFVSGGVKFFNFLVKYQQSVNEKYSMGKQYEDGSIMTLQKFENILRYFEEENVSISRIKFAAEKIHDDNLDAENYGLALAKEVLGATEGTKQFKKLRMRRM